MFQSVASDGSVSAKCLIVLDVLTAMETNRSWNHTFVIDVGKEWLMMMNEKQLLLIRGVMDSINGTLEFYEKDPTFAPADWILENWWCTLEAAINSS